MMSERKRETYLKKRLSEILRYGYRHSKSIRSRFDSLGLKPEEIRDLKDLERLPITKKADLVSAQKGNPPFGGFDVIPKKGLRRIYMSPGPVFEPGEWGYQDIRWAQALYACGLRKGDVVLNTFNYHVTPLALMLDESLQMLGRNDCARRSGQHLYADSIDATTPCDGILGNTQFSYGHYRGSRGHAP